MAAPKPRKVNANFFTVGITGNQGAAAIDSDSENRDEAWRNIKPNQNVDALSKEMYKKRKYEEFRERKEKAAASRRGKSNKPRYQKKVPKLTPEMEEKQRI